MQTLFPIKNPSTNISTGFDNNDYGLFLRSPNIRSNQWWDALEGYDFTANAYQCGGFANPNKKYRSHMEAAGVW